MREPDVYKPDSAEFVSDDGPRLCGQVVAPLGIVDLLAVTQSTGLEAEIRYSSFYETGCYLKVQSEKSTLIFDGVASNEYLVRSEADSLTELITLAKRCSKIFCQSKLRHRFELYDSQDQLVDYIHFNWLQHD